jgi:hypothetical protein
VIDRHQHRRTVDEGRGDNAEPDPAGQPFEAVQDRLDALRPRTDQIYQPVAEQDLGDLTKAAGMGMSFRHNRTPPLLHTYRGELTRAG